MGMQRCSRTAEDEDGEEEEAVRRTGMGLLMLHPDNCAAATETSRDQVSIGYQHPSVL